MDQNEYSYRPTPPPKPIRVKPDLRKVKRILLTVVVLLLAISIGSSCWYTVDEKQQAVVTTFGKVTDVTEAGIHFKLPMGIQRVEKVDVNVYQKIELGYRTDSSKDEGYTVVNDESSMITGDYNIVNVEFFVEYKISDPVKYLYSSYEPEDILRNLVQSQVRNVVGSTNVDSVLTDGKEAIQMQVKELIIETLEQYDIGLMLNDVKIQDSEPPTEEVTAAFKNVETAKQGAETVVNQAMAYQNAELPAAEAEADKLIQNAEYLKQKRINEALEQVAMFEARYVEYAQNPAITRSRMYYEAITEAFPDIRLYIDLSDGGVSKVLPLESFTDADTAGAAVSDTVIPDILNDAQEGGDAE
ncbi:MAG: FtsH protease activity modulator HflK [Ruminococcaceae bacterium]|nr:FtsH protease activity modulator HflK [Oscillospiraceae bacterium]